MRRIVPFVVLTSIAVLLVGVAAAEAAGLTASFDYTPAEPAAGEQIELRATSTSPLHVVDPAQLGPRRGWSVR